MKKIFFSIFLGVICFQNSNATIRTVCNMTYSPGQFTTFAAAIAAASNNDTIYVHGSSINYGNITINKSGIVIIGAGHNPNKQAPLPSSFTDISISSNFSNCQLIGLIFQNLTINSNCNHTFVKRCKISELTGIGAGISFTGNTTGFLLEGCVFTPDASFVLSNVSFGNNSCDSAILRNNIFGGMLNNNSIATAPLTFFISNNIFQAVGSNVFFALFKATINNNIFYRASPQGINAGNACTMNNNISFQCSNNNFAIAGTNNLTNVNPMFVNFPVAGAYFDYTHDYHFAAGSPCLISGDDGTDRGVYGGYGFKFNMTGEPAMAEITSFAITSTTIIAPGGTLNISVTSKRIK